MQDSIHGHEVLRMMIEADRAHTRDSLQAEIAERFGEDARFYTCSSHDRTAEESIEFLETRGRFRSVEGGWRVDEDEICGDAGRRLVGPMFHVPRSCATRGIALGTTLRYTGGNVGSCAVAFSESGSFLKS